MKQYTFKDGFKCVASTKEEAIKVIATNNVHDRIERDAKKVIEIINNNKLLYTKSGSIYIKSPTTRLYGKNGKLLVLQVDTGWEGHHFAKWCILENDSGDEIKLDWDDASTKSKVLKLYKKEINEIKKNVTAEIKKLQDIEKSL